MALTYKDQVNSSRDLVMVNKPRTVMFTKAWKDHICEGEQLGEVVIANMLGRTRRKIRCTGLLSEQQIFGRVYLPYKDWVED